MGARTLSKLCADQAILHRLSGADAQLLPTWSTESRSPVSPRQALRFSNARGSPPACCCACWASRMSGIYILNCPSFRGG